ncbi:erythroid differentiation-related factor 1-like [Ornithodoros turicata]|uniref:erythroid differentiation-related factor 1-like n=1 Tax=Ornithodoros turicata TaxID=34597 RepID=UPI0031397DB5
MATTAAESKTDCQTDKSEEAADANEQDSSLTVMSPVKSTAVLKYPATEPAMCYLQLSSNTNLNKPPANWLRNDITWHGLRAKWTYPHNSSTIFSSFDMANSFTEYIGEVDVISDSENIKKLLKMPYSNAHISMMVHRVGKTLLLDEFDVHKHLLRESQNQWEWLRKFFYDTVLASLQAKAKVALRKNKRRDILQNKNMFSKFLHYSVENDSNSVQKLSTCPDMAKAGGSSGEARQSVMVHESENAVENRVPEAGHDFLRNLLWTFEDIRMLIGSNMPIFGGGTRPAVSLKLRDMQKPINILTGLDYWLDNLMCNVPEVVMCYHLNGIVQKYELIKTEEIPHLKNSHFSPKVVKDVAQNVLSFLKSNAAKSGHTYWLFKGKNDDVVKLYDLTVLCSDLMDDKQQNPFTLPVAILLFRVAANMKESPDCKRKQGTIYRLLKNALQLLDSSKHLQIVSSVHSLLSDLFVPSDLDPAKVQTASPEESEQSDDSSWRDSEEDSDTPEDTAKCTESPSVSVDALCVPDRYRNEGLSDAEKSVFPFRSNWSERCRLAMNHVLEGLTFVLSESPTNAQSSESSPPTKAEAEAARFEEENLNMAKPYEPIPLKYSPLTSDAPVQIEEESIPEEKKLDEAWKVEVSKSFTNLRDPSWKHHCLQFLLQKAVRIYCAMAELSCGEKRYGRALKCIQYGLQCHEQLRYLVVKDGKQCCLESLVYLLGLAGDVYLMLVHGEKGFTKEEHLEDSESVSSEDERILLLLEKISSHKINIRYCLAGEFPQDLERTLVLSARCYASALKILPNQKRDVFERLTRRLGNISNELGVFYMNQAARIFNELEYSNEQVEHLWAKSQECLERGVEAFEMLNDIPNIALLSSNNGRLMRLRAHAAATVEKGVTRTEFTAQERMFYNKAIKYYSKAARILHSRKLYPDIWDSLHWELSSTLFTMATLLQDFAPLSSYAQEEVEKEAVELMMKTLGLCSTECSPARQPLYQYRAATIYYRLASLHHNAYRNQTSEDSRKKHLKSLAEHYYDKAQVLFETMENVTEFVRVLLEHAGMLEFQMAGLQGFNSKLNKLYSVLKLFLTSQKLMTHLNEKPATSPSESPEHEDTPEDAEDRNAILLLFEKRIQATLRSIIKLYHTPGKHRNEAVMNMWKQIYSESLQRNSDVPVEIFLSTLLSRIKDALEPGP